jgi:hypothetical protein
MLAIVKRPAQTGQRENIRKAGQTGQAAKPANVGRRPFLAWLATSLACAGLQNTADAEGGIVEEESTEGHLSGTFTRPAQMMKSHPAALIIAGSGPTPRDGSAHTYKFIAAGLAAEGICSLRYDKRGIGKSRPLVTREDDLTIQPSRTT